MKLLVTKPNLYHNGKRCAVGDTVEIKSDHILTVYLGKVEPLREARLTTDQIAGDDLAEMQEENDRLLSENASLKQENEDLRAKLGSQTDSESQVDDADTSAEADEQRKEWLLDQIEELTGKRPGSNSKIETLEAKFTEAKLAEE